MLAYSVEVHISAIHWLIMLVGKGFNLVITYFVVLPGAIHWMLIVTLVTFSL